jgi:hypothetical protein
MKLGKRDYWKTITISRVALYLWCVSGFRAGAAWCISPLRPWGNPRKLCPSEEGGSVLEPVVLDSCLKT